MMANAKSNAYIVHIADYHRKFMMDNDSNNENLRRSSYFRDVRLFSIIVFVFTLMTAALVNTQVGMKQIAEGLAFLALGYLIIGISAQLLRMRK